MHSETLHLPTLFIRADGNSIVGYGHLMRALAFATHAQGLWDVKFLLRDSNKIALDALKKYVISTIDISGVPVEEEAKYIAKISGKKSVVFLDGYNFTEFYQHEVKNSGCFLVCMDDHHERFFEADCIINVAEIDNPEIVRRKAGSLLVSGLSYALIRPEFSADCEVSQRTDQLFICFGGAEETLPLILKSLDAIALSDIHPTEVIIVTNDKLTHAISNYSHKTHPTFNVQIFTNISASAMAKMMQVSRMGICSSSTVSLEARAVGLPLIAGYYVNNQEEIYKSLLKHKEIPELGDLNLISVASLGALISSTWKQKRHFQKSIVDVVSIRNNYHKLMQSWIIKMGES